ncbi:M20 family metallopeptidase [Intestinimonas timonensis]|uniref:M20 metallopeptidase family protein n=1 Tax=Intestinimonas timonensis TaxID=1689270 RepID=UPI0023F506F5|nr:M20 family metallopeptidase [Intestinimonas timonensis]
MDILLKQAQSFLPALRQLKDDLHRHPELSWRETRTTALLKEKLTALGLELIDLDMETGCVALLQGGKPGPTVALRADIDAIVQETPEEGEVVSEVPGVMHACGHDFHTAGLYGAACLLSPMREEIAGNVAFLFQPAEETTGGARVMLSHGLWDKLPGKPACVFGVHNRPQIPAGKVAVQEGPLMSEKANFTIVLHGVTGHGGTPQKCIDVIVPAAAIIQGIQSVVSRNTAPEDPLVCAVCSIHAGTPENFSPDLLTMTGSIRAFSHETRMMAQNRVERLTRDIASAYGCGCDFTCEEAAPLLFNSPVMTALARRAAASVVGEENIVGTAPEMSSEDFPEFGREVPYFFYWLGSGFPDRENAGWHSPKFRTDDSALAIDAALLARSALEGLAWQG